jgi:DNA-binding beta-propeller fold protein YncE
MALTFFRQRPLRVWSWMLASVLSAGLLVACGGNDDEELTPVTLTLSKIGGFTHTGGASSAEISAYDAASKRLFVVNGALGTVDVLNMADPSAPVAVGSIRAVDLWAGAGGVNSVATHGGMVALAVEASPKTSNGRMVVIRASDLAVIATAQVGALPDMLTFTPDGKKILVANEGEPNSYGQSDSVDPEGSVSIVDISTLSLQSSNQTLTARTAGFQAFNSQKDALLASGVRIFGPGATVAQDLEPEYITVSDDSTTAYVVLQENNAIAVVNIASATVTDIKPLGYKDHSVVGMGMDVSNEDGGTNTDSGTALVKIGTVPVKGMYMPDAIAQFSVGGRTYLITANEGDAREYTGVSASNREDPRVREYCTAGFDPSVFGASASTLGNDSNLGRLRVTMFPGGTRTGKNSAGQCNELVAFGARSFSIWNDQMQRVFDSGDQLEQLTKDLVNVRFNASNDNNTLDDRSPAKGPEPEGVVVGKFGRKTYAFIGLERVGGVMVYDVTNPSAPMFETYLNTREGAAGDRGPEGLHLIKASDSPNGKPLLVVGNETSGTTAIYQLNLRY